MLTVIDLQCIRSSVSGFLSTDKGTRKLKEDWTLNKIELYASYGFHYLWTWKILHQVQINLCLCVSLFWCCNTLIFWRVCSSETPDCRHSWKANNVTCVRIFLLLPVNSMSVVLACDVELRPYVHTHSKGIIYVCLLEITPIFSCPSLCHVGLLRNGHMLQS